MFVLSIFLILVFICFALPPAVIQIAGKAVTVGNEEVVNAIEQEYGYQEVSFDFDEAKAEVKTSDDKAETVKVLTYKGARILFHDQEQLGEKINKVDSGTYPEELYLDR